MKKLFIGMILIFLSACSVDTSLEIESETSGTPESVETTVQYPFQDDIESLSIGKIAVLSSTMIPGRDYAFLQGLDSTIYNQYDDLDESNYDTIVVFYDNTSMTLYPPSIWGVDSIEINQILTRKVLDRNVILARFRSFQDTTRILFQLDYRFLTVQEDSTFDDFLTWQAMTPINQDSIPLQGDKNSESEIVIPIESIKLSDLGRLRPIDVCKIEQTKTHEGDPAHSKGFPLGYKVVPNKGIVNVAFIAVDFPDVQGDPALIDQWLEEIYTMEAWSTFMASGIMEYRVHFEPQWITAPKDAKWYGCEACMRIVMGDYDQVPFERLQPEMEAINQVFTAGDEYYDWSKMDFAQMMFPTKAEAAPYWVRLYSHGGNNFTPKAGNVFVPVFGGFIGWIDPEFTDYTMWDFATHEILHEQGLMGHGPYNGANYSIMQNQHGYSKMLLSWEAFLLDWWDENHLACIDIEDLNEPFIFQLDSLDQNGILIEGHKNLMIRLNDEEIVVIEYRTDGPFSDLPKEYQGITAYHININQPQFRCDVGCENLTLEEYDNRNFWRYIKDPTRNHPCIQGERHPVYGYINYRFCNQPAFVHYPGSSITWDNIKITVLADDIIEVQLTS